MIVSTVGEQHSEYACACVLRTTQDCSLKMEQRPAKGRLHHLVWLTSRPATILNYPLDIDIERQRGHTAQRLWTAESWLCPGFFKLVLQRRGSALGAPCSAIQAGCFPAAAFLRPWGPASPVSLGLQTTNTEQLTLLQQDWCHDPSRVAVL